MSLHDPSLATPDRVADLLKRMTLDEKLAQLASFWMFELLDERGSPSGEATARLLANGIGQITRAAGCSVLGPLASTRATNELQRFLVNETRLGIPAIVHEECCSGYLALGGTVFPQIIGLASTFRPELAERMTTVIRTQMRAVGAHQGLSPVLDVARDARWGRVEETFGEDPVLVTAFGTAYIKGLQGKSLRDGGIMATGKHFVGHSASQGGQNCAPVHLGPRELWEVYLMPFQAAIREAGLHTMMNSYPELDGELVAASARFLTELLRNKLGFNGLVVSDYLAIPMIHSYHARAIDFEEAASLALQAGIDVELPTRDCYGDPLRAALDSGQLPMELVDRSVGRHLEKKFELGLFDNPYADEGKVLEIFGTADRRDLAREIAGQSLVLLKNDGLLPLKRTLRRIAIIGPNAAEARNLLGDYSFASMLEHMSAAFKPVSELRMANKVEVDAFIGRTRTIMEAVQAAIPEAEVRYAHGCNILGEDESGFDEAVRAAREAEAVILVLGDRSGFLTDCSTGETRDSADLLLPGVQERLAEAVFATGVPVAVVLVNGRPYAINSIAERANAILEAWLPGEEGATAIAETLFGDRNPGGKLPMTFPRHVGQLPIYYSQKPSGGKSNWHTDYVSVPATPLYPFGHGLSYTSFEYSDLVLSKLKASAGEIVEISLKVKNCGETEGDEVVQLYVRDEFACIPRPRLELKGFIRISLRPEESRVVTFHLPVDQLAFYDEELELVVEAGSIRVMVGSSSADIRCESSFEITGEAESAVANRLFLCPVEVA
jgi:beta-glucosidase